MLFRSNFLGLALVYTLLVRCTAEAIMASTSIPLNEYTCDTLTLLRLALKEISDELIKERCKEWAATRKRTTGCDDFEIHLVEVDFDKLADSKQSKALKHLPTSFSLPVEAVDDLRAAAREIMTSSKDFQEFVNNVGGLWNPGGVRRGQTHSLR
jgi:hypothetical protein